MNLVDEYITSLDREKALLFKHIRGILLKCVPSSSETIKYGVPYYEYFGHMCYISPTKKGVNLGFTRGHQLSNEQGLLTGDGKVVRHLHFETINDYEDQEVMTIINEAILLNEVLYKQKKSRNKNTSG